MLGGVDLRTVTMIVGGLIFAAGLGWLIGLVMGAGAILLLSPTSRYEVQATLQRLFKKQKEKQSQGNCSDFGRSKPEMS